MIATGRAGAETGHDRRLAEAAARIVAERMGPLRGSIDIGRRAILQAGSLQAGAADGAAVPGLRPGEWRDGLAIAVEERRAVSPDL